ncbi:site-2 protease family protein [Bacillus taeanensis]|uniref:site-2 protease family protein n=1 Tax=Bacillus taeanensis TaxID=273032 RepID=UPI0015F0C8F4|nr:site-2 protease family protein [Bacillus taeanensis]
MIILSTAQFSHEFGHLITAKTLRIKKIVLVMGSGPTIFTIRTVNTRIEINLLFFLGGYTTSEARVETPYWKQSLIAVGGPMINLLIVFFILILLQFAHIPFYISLITPVIAVNLWIGIVNLVPFRWYGKESDGWSFIKNSILAMRAA